MAPAVIDTLASVWDSIADLAESFDGQDWKTVTECPGWTVQDQVAHIIGIERSIMGDPQPDVDLPGDLAHVKNPVGEMNEAWVESRRGCAGPEVLAEFKEVTHQRLEQIRAMTSDELAAITPSPVGDVPYEEFLGVRAFDSWIHEQDIRRAVDRPGGWDGPAAELSLSRVATALGFVVGKKAGAPDGASVLFDVEDGEPVAIVVSGGRGRLTDEVLSDPTARLVLDREALVALGGGRWAPDRALAEGRVRLEGDLDLAGRVLEEIDFLF